MFSLSKKDGKLSTLVWIVFTIFHFCPFNSKVDIYLPIYLTLERTKKINSDFLRVFYFLESLRALKVSLHIVINLLGSNAAPPTRAPSIFGLESNS